MNLNLKQKLFGSKLKKIVWSVVFLLCAIFIRTVPNYSNESNIEFTTIFGKKKYEQGYCLSEDKILDKEENFRRDIFLNLKYARAEVLLSKTIV